MEEESFHSIGNKLLLTSNLPILDTIAIAHDSTKNIESIDEEIIQASNHVNDDFYGVVWMWTENPFMSDDLVRFSLRAGKAIKTSKAIVVNPESQKFVYLYKNIFFVAHCF